MFAWLLLRGRSGAYVSVLVAYVSVLVLRVRACRCATGKMLSGEGQKGFEGWRADFLSEATGAADAVTPVGGYLLRRALD